MSPKMGNGLHNGAWQSNARRSFEEAIATALKGELGPTHQAVKTLMAWTGASERTTKHWLAGTHGPSGHYLIDLARHSDAVLFYFLSAANRSIMLPGIHLAAIRTRLVDLVSTIDANVAS